jgi:catalase
MTFRHSSDPPVYAPNSYGGPKADPERGVDLGWSVAGAEIGRDANARHAEDDDFGQAGTLYREVMSDTDRDHLVANIVGHAGEDVAAETQLRLVAYWYAVDAELGARMAGGLGIDAGSATGALDAACATVAAHANHT